ncbi:MAG: hypothetical protein RL011_905 [Pseudomonadota bacterium]
MDRKVVAWQTPAMKTERKNWTAKLSALGLQPDDIERHATQLRRALAGELKRTFPILDTCRTGSGAMLSLPELAKNSAGQGYLGFILAAGAASRYSQPLHLLSEALEANNKVAIESSLRALASEGALSWPLPERLATLIAKPESASSLSPADLSNLKEAIQLPKALMPCVKEGTTFLTLKHWEHAAIGSLSGEIYVAPSARTADFLAEIAKAKESHFGAPELKSLVLEQGPDLSTIRFHRDGSPVLDGEGNPSLVPAGHGAITKLFPAARSIAPAADSLFIRNIDNIMGSGPEATEATRKFLSLHRQLLTAVRAIRDRLSLEQLDLAADEARALMRQLLPSDRRLHDEALTSPISALKLLQQRIFHSVVADHPSTTELKNLYARPVNLMGQVPNTGNDIGGTPCFIEAAPGQPALKVSLELPHISAADRQAFLEDATIATHFNPGYCAVEIPTDPGYYTERNQDFWIMAEKTYRGEQVVYFETVIYELVGNSSFANMVFVEVPRLVFNPHKALKDAMNQSLASWT